MTFSALAHQKVGRPEEGGGEAKTPQGLGKGGESKARGKETDEREIKTLTYNQPATKFPQMNTARELRKENEQLKDELIYDKIKINNHNEHA